jgi:outer membrane protein TolC
MITSLCASGSKSIAERKRRLKTIETELISAAESGEIFLEDTAVLEEYILAGLARNRDLKAAFVEWKAAFRKISLDFSLPDPQFEYTNYIEPVETRVGPQKNAYALTQKIPLPDKLWLRKKKQFRDSESLYFRFLQKKLEVAYKITYFYYEYAYLSKAIVLTGENIQLLKQFEKVIRAKYATGIAENQDLLKVQTEIEKMENEYQSLEEMRLPLQARLNALMDLPADTVLPRPEESFDDVHEEALSNELIPALEQLEKSNPELLSLRQEIQKNREGEKLARREYFPDLTVKLAAIATGDALEPDTIDSGNDPVMLMFSVNVPIWFGKNSAGIGAAEAMVKSAGNRLKDRKNQLAAEVYYVIYKLRDNLRQARLYHSALIPRAMQTLNATKSAYEAGKVDFLSLIDSERTLLQFQLSYYKYASQYLQSAAKLRKILGEETEDFE